MNRICAFFEGGQRKHERSKKTGGMVEVNKEDCFPYLGELMKLSEG